MRPVITQCADFEKARKRPGESCYTWRFKQLMPGDEMSGHNGRKHKSRTASKKPEGTDVDRVQAILCQPDTPGPSPRGQKKTSLPTEVEAGNFSCDEQVETRTAYTASPSKPILHLPFPLLSRLTPSATIHSGPVSPAPPDPKHLRHLRTGSSERPGTHSACAHVPQFESTAEAPADAPLRRQRL